MNAIDIIRDCADEIASAVLSAWPPAYHPRDGKEFSWVLGRLGRTLYPAQFHVAAALARALKTLRGAFLVGEPSTGKTTIALAAARMLGARKVLVMAPAHLLGEEGKWAREIRAVIPDARVLEISSLRQADQVIHARATEDRPLFVLISRDRAKLGSPWRPAYHPVLVCEHPWTRIRTPIDAPLASEHPISKRAVRAQDPEDPSRLVPVTFAMCPSCGDFRTPTSELPNQATCQACGQPMWSFQRTAHGRAGYPIGRYLARKGRGAFDLLIVDEAHEYKEAGTAQGLILGCLSRAARATLAITATIASGKPSSLFYLLHRVSPTFRRQFPYSQPGKFSRAYGLLETTRREEDKITVSRTGTVSRKREVKTSYREIPGIHPHVLTTILDRACFVHLADLGASMPPYRELVHTVDMSPPQAAQYRKLVHQLLPEVVRASRERKVPLLGAYLQAALCLPDAPWRGEQVRNPETGEPVATVDPLPSDVVYPKEQAIADLVAAEAARGRKCLIYAVHTGARDISSRLQQVLESRGLRCMTLKASVSPRQREAWLQQAATTSDCVITSPRLAGSGLDLIQFSTIIWAEPDYSTYVTRQASRRTWRIGQSSPVDVHFFVYSGTLQATALSLVAQGILAASTVDGEVVTSGRLSQIAEGSGIHFRLAETLAQAAPPEEDAETILRMAASAEREANSTLDGSLFEMPARETRPSVPPRVRTTSLAGIASAFKAEQISLFEWGVST